MTGLLSVCTGAYPKSNTKALIHDKGLFFFSPFTLAHIPGEKLCSIICRFISEGQTVAKD